VQYSSKTTSIRGLFYVSKSENTLRKSYLGKIKKASVFSQYFLSKK